MGRSTLKLNSYFGPYYLEKLLAIGGMAEIYMARTRGLAGFEKQLVLKVIQPDLAGDTQFVQMLVDEAKLAVGLNHPNIAQTFDLGRIEQCYFISMEYVDGGDFFQILRGLTELDTDLPIEAAIHVVHEALCGLDYAHKKCDAQGKPLQIIHRDISPQNILLSRHGEVKIVDFGIAKAANLSHKTKAGVIKGKLVYMSPEQAWGDVVDQRTDIFSAGIVLYEALTMGSLYLEKNPAKLLERVRMATIDPPSTRRPEIKPELDALVMKALTPRPADRYQTAQEFADLLLEYQRRIAPDFTEQHLGTIVESVLAGERPRLQGTGRRAPQTGEMMIREDFAVQEHSMIFSAAEMMESGSNIQELARGAGAGPEGGGAPAGAVKKVARLQLLDDKGAEPHLVGDHFVIGRTGDLRLGDARVSRRHAAIKRSNGGYVLEDLKSSNGTYLNGNRIEQPSTLQSGDIVRVGPFEMRFFVEEVFEEVFEEVAEKSVEQVIQEAAEDLDAGAETAPPPAREVIIPRPAPSRAQGDGARVALTMGAESLTLPVGDSLLLAHTLSIGEDSLEGVTASLVRRGDRYWVEPSPGKEAVLHNGRRITSPTQLSSGDKLTVGPLELEFVLD
jgi:serine/threonine protein kinase